MNSILNYRIIEKDKFFVQKRNKLGWFYKLDISFYNIDAMTSIIMSSIFLFSVFLIFILVLLRDNIFNIYLFLSSIFLFGLTIYFLFRAKEEFDSFEEAKKFIIKEIEEKQKEKQKRKSVKIHYLDIKAERRDKLKKIN